MFGSLAVQLLLAETMTEQPSLTLQSAQRTHVDFLDGVQAASRLTMIECCRLASPVSLSTLLHPLSESRLRSWSPPVGKCPGYFVV